MKHWIVALAIASAWTAGCVREQRRPPDVASPPGSAAHPQVATPYPSGTGAVVVEQVPAAECMVFVDGQEWPEGRTLKAFRFVPPGMHAVECRGPSGVLFSRRLEVAIGRDTPLFWGP